jgi:hypothetical protein
MSSDVILVEMDVTYSRPEAREAKVQDLIFSFSHSLSMPPAE